MICHLEITRQSCPEHLLTHPLEIIPHYHIASKSLHLLISFFIGKGGIGPLSKMYRHTFLNE